MKGWFFKSIIFTLLIAIASSGFCQNTATDGPFNPKSRTEIVNSISKLLIDNYVYLDTAKKMSAKIQLELKKGIMIK